MNIELQLQNQTPEEQFYKIINSKNGEEVGIIFTVFNHVAYEIYPEYRNNGLATEALKQLLKRIDKPLLEISYKNIPSLKVAKKTGFVLKRTEGEFLVFESPLSR